MRQVAVEPGAVSKAGRPKNSTYCIMCCLSSVCGKIEKRLSCMVTVRDECYSGLYHYIVLCDEEKRCHTVFGLIGLKVQFVGFHLCLHDK